MKKLLWIIIIGLIFVNNAYSDDIYSQDNRKKSEINYWLENDCLRKLHTKVNKKELIFFEKKIYKEIQAAFNIAKNSKFPRNSESKKKLYA